MKNVDVKNCQFVVYSLSNVRNYNALTFELWLKFIKTNIIFLIYLILLFKLQSELYTL